MAKGSAAIKTMPLFLGLAFLGSGFFTRLIPKPNNFSEQNNTHWKLEGREDLEKARFVLCSSVARRPPVCKRGSEELGKGSLKKRGVPSSGASWRVT